MDRGSYENRYNLIAEYLLAIKRPATVEQIQQWEQNGSRHKVWGLWMDALARFKLKKKYFSLSDVPKEHEVYGNTVDIRTPGKLTTYCWNGEEWRDAGSIHDEYYKG